MRTYYINQEYAGKQWSSGPYYGEEEINRKINMWCVAVEGLTYNRGVIMPPLYNSSRFDCEPSMVHILRVEMEELI